MKWGESLPLIDPHYLVCGWWQYLLTHWLTVIKLSDSCLQLNEISYFSFPWNNILIINYNLCRNGFVLLILLLLFYFIFKNNFYCYYFECDGYARLRQMVTINGTKLVGVKRKKKKWRRRRRKKNGGILLNHYEYGSADDVTVSLANRRQCSS